MRVTGITQNIELTVCVFHSGSGSALSFCTEGLTGPVNEVYAGRGGAGEGSLCSDLLGIPQSAWGW